MNGKLKIGLSVAGILAVLSGTFWAGNVWAKLNHHMANQEIHQTLNQKNENIDERVRFALAPVHVKLEQIDEKVDRILNGHCDPG